MSETKNISIPPEQYAKLEDHAKQKGIDVNKEAEDLLNLAIKQIEALMAAKHVMIGGDTQL